MKSQETEQGVVGSGSNVMIDGWPVAARTRCADARPQPTMACVDRVAKAARWLDEKMSWSWVSRVGSSNEDKRRGYTV